MAMPDPKALLAEVSEELKKAQEESGLGNADALVSKLEEIKAKAEAGPGDVIDKVKETFKNFMDQIDEAINNPASLMGGGPLAACASAFAKQVLDKLKALKGEAEKLFSTIGSMASSLVSAFKDLGENLKKVMDVLAKQVKKMMSMPAELQEEAGKISGPEDLGKMDLGDIKAALNLDSLTSIFEDLGGVKTKMGPIMDSVSEAMKGIGEFIQTLPDKLANAFDTPLSKCACGAGPQALQDLMSKVEVLKKVDLQSILDTLDKTKESVSNMDVDAVKKPMAAFSASATPSVDKLDKGVSAAKAAGGLGKAMGAIGGMFG